METTKKSRDFPASVMLQMTELPWSQNHALVTFFSLNGYEC